MLKKQVHQRPLFLCKHLLSFLAFNVDVENSIFQFFGHLSFFALAEQKISIDSSQSNRLFIIYEKSKLKILIKEHLTDFQWKNKRFVSELIFLSLKERKKVLDWKQKNNRLKQPLQKFSSLFKAEPVYEGRLKVILLLQKQP